MLDITAIRRQFPYLQSAIPSTYLDSAATTQKPQAVIDAMCNAMKQPMGNVHRGQHRETEVATDAYEAARAAVAHFVGAAHADEIIFTKNCTEAINLAANAWALHKLQPGDTVVLSILEHHSNIVPWLQLQQDKGITVEWIDMDESGKLRLEQLETYLQSGPVKLVAITGQSNVLGTRPDLQRIIEMAHAHDAKVLVDAAQLIAHSPVDVSALGCDFLTFSGHKIYGPTGIGVLYASREMQKEMKPFLGGGGMVHAVSRASFTPADAPHLFEAGTPPITETLGLAAAIEWQKQFNWEDRQQHDQNLMYVAVEALSTTLGLRILPLLRHTQYSILNTQYSFSGCLSFTIDGVHPHDLTDLLGQQGFALRAGHHCAEPLHERLGVNASTRMSFGLYTTEEDIRSCAAAIKEIQKKFL